MASETSTIKWARVKFHCNWREESVPISKVFEQVKVSELLTVRKPFVPKDESSFKFAETYAVKSSQDMRDGEEGTFNAYIGKLAGT